MLQDQLERGNDGLIKSKHITFGIEADGYKTAKPRLERIETDILNNFRKLGVKAEPLDGKARLALKIMHSNRPDLFPGYLPSTDAGTDYEIPPEALEDEQFAAMMAEAEKYIGFPYVWGGSNPSTSFDCSGFVSWVVNNCGVGWSVGRLTAQGLYNICTPVSEAKRLKARIDNLTARYTAMLDKITELENLEIVGLVRAENVSIEQLAALIHGGDADA